MVIASEDSSNDNFSYSKVQNSSKLGKENLPTTEYPIWGYTGKTYNFTIKDVSQEDPSNTTMVFYWDCLRNESRHYQFLLNNESHLRNNSWICNNTWNDPGNYSVAVGVFKLNSNDTWVGVNVSYWIPVEIKNNTTIEVPKILMMDEKVGFEGSYSDHLYNNNSTYCGYVDNDYSFSVILNATSLEEADNRTINETTTIIYWNYNSLDENKSDNSILGNVNWIYNPSAGSESENNILGNVYWNYNSSAGNESENRINVTWNENFIHEWDKIGKKNISSVTYHWDPLDGEEMYSEYDNTSILIVKDPKKLVFFSDVIKNLLIDKIENFGIPHMEPRKLKGLGISLVVSGLIIFFFTYKKKDISVEISLFRLKPFDLKSVRYSTGILTIMTGMYLFFIESFLNLHNLGIYLVVAGLIIFYFTYTKNKVPVQILLFGRKPSDLRTVNSFTGTLTFITGMYLYFVFGRCPWDIPIVGSLKGLPDIYFGILYYEYTKPFLGIPSLLGIPYLSISLGLIDVLTLSLIIHLIAIPLYKGELKFKKPSRIKSSSAPAQSQQGSYSIEEIKHSDN